MRRWCGARAFPITASSRPGERDWYAPIVYLEPFNDNNRHAFGYDTGSEEHRRTTLEQARDSGQPALSAKIRLVQEVGEPAQSGFLVVLPVYNHPQPVATLAQRRSRHQRLGVCAVSRRRSDGGAGRSARRRAGCGNLRRRRHHA